MQKLIEEEIVDDMVQLCMTKGIIVRTAALPTSATSNPAIEFEHMGISLFPTPFPVSHYNKAKELQPHLGILLGEMTRQPHFIHSELAYFNKTDAFLNNLIKISSRYN
jgi:hypothetical protein